MNMYKKGKIARRWEKDRIAVDCRKMPT